MLELVGAGSRSSVLKTARELGPGPEEVRQVQDSGGHSDGFSMFNDLIVFNILLSYLSQLACMSTSTSKFSFFCFHKKNESYFKLYFIESHFSAEQSGSGLTSPVTLDFELEIIKESRNIQSKVNCEVQ